MEASPFSPIDALLEACPDAILLVEPSGCVAFANQAATAWVGPPGERPREFFALVRPEDREGVRSALSRSKPGDVLSLEFRAQPEGRGVIHLQASVRNALDGPSMRGYVVSLRESRVHPDQAMLGSIMKKLPVMACRIDADGIIRESFGGALPRIGLADGQAVGMSAFEGWPFIRAHMEEARSGRTAQFEFESRRTERRVFDVNFISDPADASSVLGFGVDITERKHAENDLAKSEALNRRVIESSRDCIVLLDVDGNVQFISKSGRGLMEIEGSEDFTGASWLNFWKDRERSKAEAALASALETGVGKFHGFCPTLKGRAKWWDVIITPVFGPDEKPERLLAVARDITETKDFEETLRRSRDQLEAILKAITDAVLVTDANGWVVYANDAAARFLGHKSEKDILGRLLGTLVDDFEIRDEAGNPAKAAFQLARQAGGGPEGRYEPLQGRVMRFRRRGESEDRWLVLNSNHIQDAEGGILLHIDTAYDITDRKRTENALRKSEEQLRQSQKMEAMGRLAGGVAHDFNNLLTAINGYGEILAHAMAEDDPLRANVEEIRRAGERAASLTRQLLTFSRKQVLSRRVADLNSSVSEIRQMLVRLIGEDVKLETLSEPGLAPVNIDPGQVEQVIMNLALNSRDAMPMGGKLIIETANVNLDPRQSGIFFPIDAGPYVRLTVTDTGVGMGDDVKAHLFEPFFTTKPQGQGTGLGLCTVYGIIKQAGGNISVWSKPNKGTSISIFLPALKKNDAQTVRTESEPCNQAVAKGGETVLLAEDEEVVRRLVSQLLETHGYSVLSAASGPEALDLAQRHEGSINLLLTDVVMGGMSGRELAEKLLAFRPATKVLYMSGYTDDAILRHGIYQNNAAFLSKPFSTAALIRKIRDVLEMQESGRHAAGSAVPGRADLPSPAEPN